DVKFAFDSMDHDVLTQSLLHMGASHGMVGLLLQELHGLRGRFAIPGAGDTEFFNYERGGKQGGVETPDCWNAIVECASEPVVANWSEQGWGVRYDGNLIHHAIWADNIVFFATDPNHLQHMVSEATLAFAK
ncbi:unnamed protein product, partial [Prorocentrum cordatum]